MNNTMKSKKSIGGGNLTTVRTPKKIGKKLLATLLTVAMLMGMSTGVFAQANSLCSHINVSTVITGKFSETCYYDIYSYKKTCNLCGTNVENGTISYPKTTPTHNLSWYSEGCTRIKHTYVKKCTSCGNTFESMTVNCNGNCVYPNSIILKGGKLQ